MQGFQYKFQKITAISCIKSTREYDTNTMQRCTHSKFNATQFDGFSNLLDLLSRNATSSSPRASF
jgi:hypothetical protein